MASGYKEVRGKLGIFGWLWRLFFWGWQILMVAWFLSYTAGVAPLIERSTTDLERGAAGFGIALSWGLILFFWVGGSIILGLFVLFTRPARTLAPIEDRNS